MSELIAALFAALPILVVLVLMVFFRRSAALAGGIGLVVSIAIAATVFAPRGEAELQTVSLLGGAMGEAVFTGATILWIIFGALCLFHLQKRTGHRARTRQVGRVRPGEREGRRLRGVSESAGAREGMKLLLERV